MPESDVQFLQQKMEIDVELREKEIQLEKEKLELKMKKLSNQQDLQNNFVAMFAKQMQQSQEQTQQLTSALLENLSK